MSGGEVYHDTDDVETSVSDGGNDCYHHISISQVDVRICRCKELKPIEEAHIAWHITAQKRDGGPLQAITSYVNFDLRVGCS
jgi:hypothetical protein